MPRPDKDRGICHRTIRPGQPGSVHWLKQYGDRLVCVRYRYREDGSTVVTVEIVVQEKKAR